MAEALRMVPIIRRNQTRSGKTSKPNPVRQVLGLDDRNLRGQQFEAWETKAFCRVPSLMRRRGAFPSTWANPLPPRDKIVVAFVTGRRQFLHTSGRGVA